MFPRLVPSNIPSSKHPAITPKRLVKTRAVDAYFINTIRHPTVDIRSAATCALPPARPEQLTGPVWSAVAVAAAIGSRPAPVDSRVWDGNRAVPAVRGRTEAGRGDAEWRPGRLARVGRLGASVRWWVSIAYRSATHRPPRRPARAAAA